MKGNFTLTSEKTTQRKECHFDGTHAGPCMTCKYNKRKRIKTPMHPQQQQLDRVPCNVVPWVGALMCHDRSHVIQRIGC